MSLDSILSNAAGGLANIDRQLGVVGQNVSNAGTVGYSREIGTQTSVTADGVGMGVRTGLTGRAINAPLQAGVTLQSAAVSGLQTRQAALQAIDSVQGATGQGQDLASLVGALGDSFTALQGDPSSQAQQSAVVTAAGQLAGQVRALAGAVGTARQDAQDGAVSEVASLNATLSGIGQISDQIMSQRAAGQSTADLENQRDALVGTLASIVPVRSATPGNGDLLLVTPRGVTLPTHSATGPFSLAAATLGPNATYPNPAVPGVMLGNQDVTRQLTGDASGGGQLGANLQLRDATLPAYQGTLDEFAHTLAGRFDAQGLRLFSDPSGGVPPPVAGGSQVGYVGLANAIQVNPAVAANPSLVRDGTQPVVNGTGGASAFTPNPTGAAGFTGMINRVLDYALGSQAQAGVPQPAASGGGLGPAGDQSSGFTPPADLGSYAGALVGAMAQDSAATTTDLGTEQGLQTSLQGKLTAADGVNVDTEMSNMVVLQNAYGANAKVISAVQSMWTTLLGMVV